MWSIVAAAGAGGLLAGIMLVMHRLRPPTRQDPEPPAGPPVVREPEPGREPTAADEDGWRPYAAELLDGDALRYGIDVERRWPAR